MRRFFDDDDDTTDDPDARVDADGPDGAEIDDADADPEDDDALDNERLDDEFPRGDGTADVTAAVFCPYCSELNEIAVDPGGGSAQRYVEDCQVCCRPWVVSVAYDSGGQVHAAAEAADDL